jgi:hypothetical protein
MTLTSLGLDCGKGAAVERIEVSHIVPFVPVGWGRRLQRIEGKSLILVLVASIPTAPTIQLIRITYENGQTFSGVMLEV